MSRDYTDDDFHLCYMDTHDSQSVILWFADCDPIRCWGDDWDDAPFEHNAGDPYFNGPTVESIYQSVVVSRYMVDDILTDHYVNSPYSVHDLNERRLWLLKINGTDFSANDTLSKLKQVLYKWG